MSKKVLQKPLEFSPTVRKVCRCPLVIKQIELIDTAVDEDVKTSIPGDLAPPKDQLSKNELKDLMKFLKALTAPRLNLRLRATIPDSVPSGLPIDGS